MKDLNICCDESECNNCAFNGLDTFCTLARHRPNTKIDNTILKEERK